MLGRKEMLNVKVKNGGKFNLFISLYLEINVPNTELICEVTKT